MADQQETIELDSKALFESALNDEPATQATPEPEHVEQKTDEQPRGPDGKFAAKTVEPEPPKTETAPAVAAQTEPAKDEAHVPSWRLKEIREERDTERRLRSDLEQRLAAAERQLKSNEPKPEPVDLYADPNAWAKQQFKPFEDQIADLRTNLTLRASRAENVAIYGKDAVEAAEKAIDEAVKARDPDLPALTAKLRSTDDPVGVAIQWHKSRSITQEIGGDIEAYKEKLLSDPAFLAKAMERAKGGTPSAQPGQSAPKPVYDIPPSLNRAASAASALDEGGDLSNESLFKNALG